MSAERRWLVETAPEQFQTVQSQRLRVDGGTLVFDRLDGMGGNIVELAFAAGQWLTVCEEDQ